MQIYGSIFYQEFTDFIEVETVGFDDNTGNFLKQYRNNNGATLKGAELSAAYWLTSYVQISTKHGYVTGKTSAHEYVRTITPYEGSLELDYDDETFSAYGLLSWATAMSRVPVCQDNLGIIGACAKASSWIALDVGGSYKPISQLKLSANLMNLFDRNYTRYQDVAGILATDTHYMSQAGRYFTLNMRYEF